MKNAMRLQIWVLAMLALLVSGVSINDAVAREKAIAPTELTFTFNSPDSPWTAEEMATLQNWIGYFYPHVKQCYGQPAASGVVNITRGAGNAYFNQGNGNGEITFANSVVAENTHILIHELHHAFRGPFVITNNVFEEGMARTCEVSVMSNSSYSYYNPHHRYSIDVYYEANNQNSISASKGNIFAGFTNTLMRYQQAGYAWGKCLIENPSFLAKFNQKYYAQARMNSGIRSDSRALQSIARRIMPKVEGKKFDLWFSQQAIFNFDPPTEGYQMVFKQDGPAIYLYYRYANGIESMVPQAAFIWQKYDFCGVLLNSGKGVTNNKGWDWVKMTPPSQTRSRYVITATLPNGQTLTREFTVSNDLPSGLFGIVMNHDSGTIQAKDPSGAKYETSVINGAFVFPELDQKAGIFKLAYKGDGVKLRRTITKDAAPYYTVIGQ